MSTETKDKQKKFGSAYKAKRYDEWHASDNDNDYVAPGQPEYSATSKDHGEDKVNTLGEEHKSKNPTDTDAEVSTPSEVVQSHGPATAVEYTHDHEAGTHHVHSTHADGHEHHSDYDNPALAYEAGGELQAVSMTKKKHSDQQGASSEGDTDGVPQHEAADLA